MRVFGHLLFVLGVVGVLVGSPLSVTAQTPPPSCPAFTDLPAAERVLYYMGEGAGLVSARQYGGALTSYSCVIDIDPDYAPAYGLRGLVYALRQEYEAALADYTAALNADSDYLAALNNRGVIHAALRDYDAALADFAAVLAAEPDDVFAYANRGTIRALQGDYPTAIADLEQAITLSGIEAVVAELTRTDRTPGTPLPVYEPAHAQMYAVLGIIYSGYALDNYRTYLLLRGGSADARVQSAAGSLESRFNFELRLDDGTWLLLADLDPADGQ